uniref:Uncharacterized protein n=1 Tax=Hucho hucho TaxID=62062 RepID=A0A4W5LDD1_9TELE
MDIEDDTTVFATLKSFKSFISLPDTSRNQGEPSPVQSDVLQKQYLQRLELLEAAEKVQSKTQLIQMDQEKRQMEISHKRARIELEKNATLSARDFEVCNTHPHLEVSHTHTPGGSGSVEGGGPRGCRRRRATGM